MALKALKREPDSLCIGPKSTMTLKTRVAVARTQPFQHLLSPNYAFEFIYPDWFDLNGDKFLVLVDWYSGYFEVKGPVNSPYANAVICYLREWFVNNAVCDYFCSDGGPPFGSAKMNDFLTP